MKKKRIILVSALLLLIIAVLVYVERRHRQDEQVDLWALVPESAAMVYETSSLSVNWETLHNSPLWDNLETVERFKQLESDMQLLDSLLNLQEFFSSKRILIGTHVVAKGALDFSFFFRIENTREYNKMVRAINSFKKQSDVREDSRMFNGFRINELTDRESGLHFSYLIYRDAFVGSFTPFLVEDVVRNIESESEQLSFREINSEVAEFPKLANDEGNIYLNTRMLPLLLSVFINNELQPYLRPLAHLSKTIFLDANLTDHQLLLNGFSRVPGTPSADNPAQRDPQLWLSTFSGEEPQTIGLYNFVPERTAMMFHLGMRSGDEWLKKLYAHQQKSDEALVKQTLRYRENLLNYHNIALDEFTGWFGKEMALLLLESIDVEHPDKVLIMHTTDAELTRQKLNRLENKLKQDVGSLSYQEDFAGYQISEISYKEFPASMIGPMALGFEQCFYLLTENYVVFANSIRALKRLIADRESENTWDKSVQELRFLESSLDRSNVSLFFNTARSWRMLLAQLTPEWKSYALRHEAYFKSYDHLAVQFSNVDNDYYTSLALSYEPMNAVADKREQFRDISRLFVDNTLSTKPYVVRDHTNQTLEVVFQDETSQFYLSELNGELQWKDSVGGNIIGEVYQIDFFDNGKLQYLFATDSAIHVIDRNGDYVSGYPSYMPKGVQVKHFSLVDYNNSKNYRFLVGDQEGKLWMFNKDRENLQGWNPNNTLTAPLATPAFHVRVRDKDFLLAIQEDGEIYALNRRGQPYAGFPIDLNKSINSPAYVELGSSLANTEITTVSTTGEVVAFNLEGSITRREQVYRPSPDTRFQLCLDALGKTYTIVRQDKQLFGVMDYRARLLFEKDFISPAALSKGKLEVQYYNFGAGNEIFAVTDQVQEFTYLFNSQGILIKDRPIESRFPVGILFYENENRFQVFRNFENEFSVLSFSL